MPPSEQPPVFPGVADVPTSPGPAFPIDQLPGVLFHSYVADDGRMGFRSMSAQARDLFGFDPAEAVRDWQTIPFHPRDGLALRKALRDSVRTGRRLVFTGRLQYPDGSFKWWRTECRPVRGNGETEFFGMLVDVTAEVRARQNFAALFEALPDPCVLLAEDRIIAANQAATLLFGLPALPCPSERLALSLAAGEPPAEGLLDRFARESAASGQWSCEVWAGASGPDPRCYDAVAKRLSLEKGAGCLLLLHDITGKTDLEAELRRLSLVARHTTTGVIITDAQGRVQWINDGFTRISGYRLDELRAHKPGQLLQGPETDPQTIALMGRCIATGQRFRAEVLNYHKDGHSYWIDLEANPVRDSQGRLTHYIGIQTDITERKRAQQALQESEARYRRILETAQEGVWVVGHDHRTTFVNPRMAEMLGYTVAEMIGRPVFDFMPEALIPRALERYQRRAQGFSDTYEIELRRKDGSAFWGYVSANPNFTPGGQLEQILAMIVDISPRKRVEEALVYRDGVLRGLIDSLTQLLSMEEDFTVAVTRAFQRLGESVGVDRVYLFESYDRHRTLRLLFEWAAPGVSAQIDHPEWQQFPWEPHFVRWRELLTAGAVVSGHVAEFPELERHFLQAQQIQSILVVPYYHAGQMAGTMGFDSCRQRREFGDTEVQLLRIAADGIGAALERRQNLADLQQAKLILEDLNQRLAREIELTHQLAARAEEASLAKSRFLANMSHEIRTPLNSILGYAQLLQRSGALAGHDKETSQLATIQRSGAHLLTLINDILDLSRIEAGKYHSEILAVDMHHFFDESIAILRLKAEEKGLAFSWEPAGPDPLPLNLEIDSQALRQVLVNLLGNALKFTEQGSVTLQCGFLAGPGPEEGRLLLDIVDTGIGIPVADQARLFREFEQLVPHERGGGAGLGLTISRKLVERMGGIIEFSSQPGQGSCFSVELPVRVPRGQPLDGQDSGSPALVGYDGPPRLILVVDDDEGSRRFLRDLLESVGFVVTEATNGDSALQALAGPPPDLVITDLCMPSLDGWELLRRLESTEETGRIPVLAVSASLVIEDARARRAEGFCAFVSKPINDVVLLEEVGKVLKLRWKTALAGDASLLEEQPDDPDAIPPREQLEALLRAAELGDLAVIEAWLEAPSSAAYTRVAGRMRGFLQHLNFERLSALLRALMQSQLSDHG